MQRVEAIEALKKKVGDSHPRFFNRNDEMTSFLDIFKHRPSSVNVVLGPNHCGKTAFIKQFKGIWMEDTLLKHTSPILSVNCRLEGASTPKDLGHCLVRSFKQLVTASDYRVTDFEIGFHLSLSRVMSLLNKFIEVNVPVVPIIIVEHVSTLHSWDVQDMEEFVEEFKSLCNRAYLILSTSDGFLFSQLKTDFHTIRWRGFGLGNFSEADAKMFLEEVVIPHLTAASELPAIGESWAVVYEACGGGPHLLKTCASFALTLNGWGKAAVAIVEGATLNVRFKCFPTQDMGYSRESLTEVSKMVIECGGAVGISRVVRDVFGGNEDMCRQQVKNMVKSNALQLRYCSREMKYSDFTRPPLETDCEYLMATSPAVLVALKNWLRLPVPFSVLAIPFI